MLSGIDVFARVHVICNEKIPKINDFRSIFNNFMFNNFTYFGQRDNLYHDIQNSNFILRKQSVFITQLGRVLCVYMYSRLTMLKCKLLVTLY